MTAASVMEEWETFLSFIAQLRTEMSCVWPFMLVQREQHISSMYRWA